MRLSHDEILAAVLPLGQEELVGALAVTAVVPTHNRPDYMKRAVQSIVDQEYAGMIEIIVVFDACEVELPDIALPANRELRGLRNERTRGLAGGRNTGIVAATHDFVAFLDDDDAWLPAKLARQMARFAENPSAILVGTAMVVDDSKRLHERLVPSEAVTHNELLHDRLAGLHSSSFVFRREALMGDLGLIDELLPLSYGEDYDILLRTSAIMDVVVINEALVSVTWQGQSFFFGKWAAYAEALEYLLDKHPDFHGSPAALGRIESQIAFALAASGQRKEGARWARQSIGHSRGQIKAYLALAIAMRLTTGRAVARTAAHFGKGI